MQQIKMLSRALNTLTFFAEGQASYMHVTQADIKAVNALPEHLNAIVNYGLDIEGVNITFLGDELPDGSCVKLPSSISGVSRMLSPTPM